MRMYVETPCLADDALHATSQKVGRTNRTLRSVEYLPSSLNSQPQENTECNNNLDCSPSSPTLKTMSNSCRCSLECLWDMVVQRAETNETILCPVSMRAKQVLSTCSLAREGSLSLLLSKKAIQDPHWPPGRAFLCVTSQTTGTPDISQLTIAYIFRNSHEGQLTLPSHSPLHFQSPHDFRNP
jgi:hypothetical protein